VRGNGIGHTDPVFLTITSTERPATDLGFLLHKHPDRAQSFSVSGGSAHVFYPRASEDECTAALMVEIDPIGLVRSARGGGLTQYVNDRPYAAGSQLAVALRTVFSTAMAGRCDKRPELPGRELPLSIHIPSLSGSLDLATRLFAPLGWEVDGTPVPLDPEIPGWGESRYLDLRLRGRLTLSEALRQVYVLLPVLDGSKHYWVSEDEVDKLLHAGEGWLAGHPERELITKRYLAHRRSYVESALAQLTDDPLAEPVVTEAPDQPQPLAAQRQGSVLATLRAVGAERVLDLGCGGGALLRLLLKEPSLTEIVGVDVSVRALEVAARKLGDHPRLTLRQSALTYADSSLSGYDAAVLMEVVEHLDPERLPAMEHAVFAVARPKNVIVTTPNAEYNVRFEGLPAGRFRHSDHRFEWTRAEFRDWAAGVAERQGYRVRHLPVGAEDPDVGAPTQLAVFSA
jgi:3' terminal RNA ribose 2'-O-methyltransferase Hen1